MVETGNNEIECISGSIVCQEESEIIKDTPLENVLPLEESVCTRIGLTSQNQESKENHSQDKIENADTKSTVYNTPQSCPCNEEQTETSIASNATNCDGNILPKVDSV